MSGTRLRQAAMYGGLLIGLAAIAASGPAEAAAANAHATHHHRHVHHRHHPAKPSRPVKHKAHSKMQAPRHMQAKAAPAAPNPAPVATQPNPAPVVGGAGAGAGSGGGGSGGGGWSDRRLKRDIRRIGTSPSGLALYSFRYVWGGPVFVGVMAQEVLALRPDAVIETESGYLMVDYDKIDVTMTTLDAYLASETVCL